MGLIFLRQSTGRTNHNTLSAIYTARCVKPFLHSGTDKGFTASVNVFDSRNTNRFFTHAYTSSAKDTFFRIANDTGTGMVEFKTVFISVNSSFNDVIFFCKALQFTIIVSYTIQTIIRMV